MFAAHETAEYHGAYDTTSARFIYAHYFHIILCLSWRKLKGKYKLGIVSNFAIPECVTKLLEIHRIAKFFDVVIVSGAVNKRKPSPKIFQQALNELNVDASETVFVGDTIDADVKGAKDANMKTIFIERRVQKEAEQLCPDQTIKSLGDLLEALEHC